MFSLKKTIDKLDIDELRFHTVRDCYLAAISAVQEHALDVTPELTTDFGLSLQALHRALRESSSVEELTQSRATLIHALADYKAKAGVCLARKEEDLRGMITSLAEAAEAFNGHNDRHSEGLKKFTHHLQAVARGVDFSEMRRDLAKRVVEFKVMQEEISRDNSGLVAGMQKQLAEFQERLESTERRAVMDSLTGLLNRGEGEARLVARLAAGQPLSVILVDLDNFKQINDHFGHIAGDQVLKTFGHILTHSIRPADTVCRWGGDEFLVMLTVNELIAEQRAVQLRDKLKTQCKLTMTGKIFDVSVRASLGIAHAVSGETFEDLITRADTDLYHYKRAGK